MKFCWHAWVCNGSKKVTEPKLGPFDPRSDKQRTFSHEFKICAKCGKEKEYVIFGRRRLR